MHVDRAGGLRVALDASDGQRVALLRHARVGGRVQTRAARSLRPLDPGGREDDVDIHLRGAANQLLPFVFASERLARHVHEAVGVHAAPATQTNGLWSDGKRAVMGVSVIVVYDFGGLSYPDGGSSALGPLWRIESWRQRSALLRCQSLKFSTPILCWRW